MNQTDRPIYECLYVERPPNPEDLSDRIWRSAPWVEEAFHPLGLQGERPRFALRAAAVWGDQALHVAFLSQNAPVSVTRTERDEDLFNECAVELFLGAEEGFYEIEVNPLGTILDLYCSDASESDWREMAKFDVQGLRAHVQGLPNEDRWFARLTVPWAGLPRLSRESREGKTWLAGNFARSQMLTDGTADYTSWSHAKRQFHERDWMGWLILTR